MSVEELAKHVAGELEGELGEDLVEKTGKVISGEVAETRSILGTAAEIVTIASFIVTVATYAWDKFRSTKDRSELQSLLEAEFEDVPVLTEEKRKKIINKILDKLVK